LKGVEKGAGRLKSEAGSKKLGIRSWKTEAGGRKQGVRSWKTEAGRPMLEDGSRE
jgi:hypothetical protein